MRHLSLFSPSGYIAEHYGYKASLIMAGIFMGLSGCVTILLCILQCIYDRKENSQLEKPIKTDATIVMSDSSEGDELKTHHSTIDIQSKK